MLNLLVFFTQKVTKSRMTQKLQKAGAGAIDIRNYQQNIKKGKKKKNHIPGWQLINIFP